MHICRFATIEVATATIISPQAATAAVHVGLAAVAAVTAAVPMTIPVQEPAAPRINTC